MNQVVGIQALDETDGLYEVEVYLIRDLVPGFFAWLASWCGKTRRNGSLNSFPLSRLMDASKTR